MPTPHWEHFEHQADMGIRGYGNTLAEAFEQAALAMTAVITDVELIADNVEIKLSCENEDIEILLLDWLNTLIFEMATRRLLFSRFHVDIEHAQLNAQVWGETIDVGRHHPAVEIKGATFTELRVHQSAQQEWVAQCVIDV